MRTRSGPGEDQAEDRDARFRALVRYSSDVITVIGADGAVRLNTPAVTPLLGYQPEELVGRAVWDFVHPDDLATVQERFAAALAAPGTVVAVTFRFRHRSGHWVPLESVGSNRLDDPSVQGVVVNSRDLTDRYDAEREKTALLEQLEDANRLKSEFVATMSHELRTPLNIILGYHSLLLDGTFGALSGDQHDAVLRAERNARSLLELISTTLDLSRLESGRVPLDLRELAVADLFSDLEAELRDLPLRPGVRVDWHPVPTLPVLVTDAAKLKVVLKNLLGNAAKFTHAGTIDVRAAARRDGIEIAVVDSGIGIAAEHVPVIFDAFRQAGGAAHGGVGLGLYIVRRLLDERGGTVQVESAPARGSTFRVWVPVR